MDYSCLPVPDYIHGSNASVCSCFLRAWDDLPYECKWAEPQWSHSVTSGLTKWPLQRQCCLRPPAISSTNFQHYQALYSKTGGRTVAITTSLSAARDSMSAESVCDPMAVFTPNALSFWDFSSERVSATMLKVFASG